MYILGVILFVVFVIILPCITMNIYNKTFGERCEVREYEAYKAEQFENLELQPCSFNSNKGLRLSAYKYSKKGITPKGVFVFVHGLCGGHRNYLDVCNYFASNGYLVFTYDATGNGESEGTKVGGFAQGLADLDYALNFVKEQPEYKGLPIFLMGHSWGGYCVGNILNFHPDVKAVVSVSGFDTSAALLRQYSEVHMGKAVTLLMPYVSLYERICWGKYATVSACQGFANSKAKVMIIHSTDDPTVFTENGYGRYYEKFASDDRFVFKLYNDRGHTFPVNSDKSRAYRLAYREKYFKAVEEGGEAAGKEYLDTYTDRTGCMELDEALMTEILELFSHAI